MNRKQKIATTLVSLAVGYIFVTLGKYWLADFFYAQGQFDKAILLSPNEPVFKADYALSLASDKDSLPLAVSLLNQAVTESPRDVKLLKTVSLAYGDLAELDQTLLGRETETLLNLHQLAPNDPWITYQLALSYLKQGQRELAIKYLRKTVTLKPNYEKAQEILTRFGILHI